ncbi:hypothetical protein [Grimontia sp. SpTr1]|uniref:hypothetical protein n=1 Tax=Grimontia sp. SpTr1 TaxID=2995319 RepID=UPI00248C7092|nr:hypothetical protein [Grimontia sp. SpTr1]
MTTESSIETRTWDFNNRLPLAWKLSFLPPLAFFVIFLMNHEFELTLFLASLLVFIVFFLFFGYLFSHELVEINSSTLEHSYHLLGVTYKKRKYPLGHIHNLRVYPSMSKPSFFDPQGPFSEQLRLHMLGGSVVFDYGPLHRSIQMFKGMPEKEALKCVAQMTELLNEY